jgi:hypothetical protein
MLFKDGELQTKWRDKPDLSDWRLKVPVKCGDGWEYEETSNKVTAKFFFSVHGPERVIVPAGTFQARRVEERCELNAPQLVVASSATAWYSPGLGMVRWTDGRSTTVLKSFSRGKD